MPDENLATAYLMYFLLPVWLLAGFADWLCHRRTSISTTTGIKESLIHLLMLLEIGVPLLAAMFLQVNALIFLLMLAAFVLHELTALWDVSYAVSLRDVKPSEQHVHSFLEMIPLMGLSVLALLHWQAFLSLFGLGEAPAEYALRWKQQPLPAGYLACVLGATLLLAVLPYLEELHRDWRDRRRAAASTPAR
ncbi:diguanylate cyclase [Pseudomonas sp. RIT-PI-AD]|uniref:diguanylate cyclase n=1 Tax=Pseudomonas sp. RIT-PI-AD TaxID=3035294 RepID=UPI0021D93DC5|nr:diguanylate cyclase [Pseudomonas sp. RIT-PI-AD]